MGAVLDAPMPTIEVQQALRAGFGGSEGGDEIDDLPGGFVGFDDGASELSDLRDKGPGRGKIGIHLGTDLDGASPSAVNRLGLQIACLRIGKIGCQVLVEGGLIAFDGQDGLGSQCMHEAQELGVGMQGIRRTHALPDGQHWQHLLGDGDARWFSRRRALGRRFLGCDG